MVMKSVKKAIRFREVIIATKKPAEFTAEKTCLAKYNEKSGPLIMSPGL